VAKVAAVPLVDRPEPCASHRLVHFLDSTVLNTHIVRYSDFRADETMARPREFDTREALGQALDVFWAKGYEGASVCALMDAMGLSKSSFYDSFGSKRELFLKVIDRYAETSAAGFDRALTGEGSGRRAIADMFAAIVEEATCEAGRHGCFAANCAVENAGADDRAGRRLGRFFKQFEGAIETAVRQAQGQGEIPADKDPTALARFLMSSINGIRVIARVDPDPAALRDVARIALQALD